jgi:deoxyribose-phosphate aldolase
LTEITCLEAERAFEAGATEIDAVLALSRVVSADWGAVRDQIEALQAVVVRRAGALKVILETGLFEKRADIGRVCDLCCDAGVAFVKTSTGFAMGRTPEGALTTLGATVDDVRLLVANARSRCRVKASGGIRTLEDAIAMLDAGADRLGTGATAAILEAAVRASA